MHVQIEGQLERHRQTCHAIPQGFFKTPWVPFYHDSRESRLMQLRQTQDVNMT